MAIRKPIAFGKVLFDHYTDVGNVGAGEDDLYSDTIPAGQLQSNGDKLDILFTVTPTVNFTGLDTADTKVYFAGTLISSNSYTGGANNPITHKISIIRVSSSVVRCIDFAAGNQYAEITGLTLSNSQVLKITGQSNKGTPANNDIVAKMGYVNYIPSA